ncbi:MAG: histidine kinase [Bacteroidales bacterium]|jgi:ligand-binding sensor domain-containing protein|nr:histidine kinase [Bacteroidales bacterium]
MMLVWDAAGQQPNIKFNRLTTENRLIVKGLSQNSIYCLIQDSRGFIWIGTWDGLNRYDGYEFLIYNTTNGLSHPTIRTLLEDDEKNLWIGTDNGLNHMDISTGKIRQYHHEPGNPNCLTNDFINHICQDKNGFIWISTAYGLNRYDKSLKTFTSYNFFERNADTSYTNFVTKVLEDDSGIFWIATHRGIHRFNAGDQSFQSYKMVQMVSDPAFRKGNYIQDLEIDENGQVYAATLNGIYIINPMKGIIHKLQAEPGSGLRISGNQVNDILIDSKEMIWIGTNQGLDLYDLTTNLITSFKSGMNLTNLSNEDVRSIYEDQSGAIWIGTYKGLNKVDQSPSRFMNFQNEPENPNSLSNSIIYSMLEDEKGLLWIATYGGVNIFDRVNEKFSWIMHDPDDQGSLSSNKTRTLALDSSGYMWIGTENDGINRLDRTTGRINRYKYDAADPSSLSENNILSTYVDSRGRIWIGTVSKGINILDPVKGTLSHLSSGLNSKVRLLNAKIWTVYEDRDGYVWLGTDDGLNKISPDLQSVIAYQNDPTNPNSLSSNSILSIFQDADGYFWIGTMGGGLNRFDPVSGKFLQYSERDGLPNNVVYASLEDEEGNLWISTNSGLSKFNKINGTFVNYDAKDGVAGNEFNVGAYFKNKNGEMFFGGMNGINIFHPSEITLNKVPPRMVFTGFRVLNDLLDTYLEDGEVIRLHYNENFFSFEFSGLDYTNPPKNLYRYKLDNYDDDWIYVTASQRRADYRKVDPGTYRFLVTGSNNDGVWNQEGIHLVIVISPPWWKTWIFRISFLLVSVALLWSIIVLRINNIRKKHEVEKKMLTIEKQVFELEQKALRLQMNPHFIFNSLNAIQNFVLANDTDKAVNYLAKFSHLMRMILANSTASLITLKDELNALTYYMDLEKLRFDDKFDYKIIREPAVDEEFVEIPPMLFQPFVENAIIHGLVNSPNPGFLEISVRQVKPGILLCAIRDNGIGREKAIELRNKSGIKRQPKGMTITRERIEIFNNQNRKNFSVKVTDLKDQNGEPAGTLVEFTIQYKEI